MAKARVNQEKERATYYTSLQQWELENFPNLIKQRERKELERNPEALGTAIADKIFREIGIELSKNHKSN